jgi:hypothetical protein
MTSEPRACPEGLWRPEPPNGVRQQQVPSDAVPKKRATRPKRARMVALTVAAVLVLSVGGYVVLKRTKPSLLGDGCQATVSGHAISLATEQAAIASTIAGVGARARMPAAAVTVAYATALQESHLLNLDYGDRDSVGVFQQRPSQGWGSRAELTDPVYAASMFFAALGRVRGYQEMPVYRAAQAVQHSADGSAYGQYEQVARWLAEAFTGTAAHSVWCWYDGTSKQTLKLAAVGHELTRTFGRERVGQPIASGPGPPVDASGERAPLLSLRVRQAATGWAIATWSVAHAKAYAIKTVRYAGFQWRAASGDQGWGRDAAAPASRVELS